MIEKIKDKIALWLYGKVFNYLLYKEMRAHKYSNKKR